MASKDNTTGVAESTKPSLREWVKRQADSLDVDEERILFNSKTRDPMYKGTNADWEKARWFARQYEAAVSKRESDQIHVRGIHYSTYKRDEDVESWSSRTSWDVYQNTEQCYNAMKEASIVARILGTVPLDAVIDEKNDQTVVTKYQQQDLAPQPDEVLNIPTGIKTPEIPEASDTARLTRRDDEDMADALGRLLAKRLGWELVVDSAAYQPFHIEIWSEKTVPASTHDIAEKYGVNAIVEGQGDLSYTVANNLAQRIGEAEKPAVILYLSDFDPKGDNMAAAMAGKLAWLHKVGHLDQRVYVEQLAVTREQIKEFDLARKPIDDSVSPDAGAGEKAYQTLVNEWEKRKGAGAVELQSFWSDESRYRSLVEEAVRGYRDNTLSDRIAEQKSEWQDAVAEEIADHVRDSGLMDDVEALEEWVEEFNDEWAEVQEALEDVRDLKDDDRYTDWTSTARQTLRDADAEEFEPPEGEADPPSNPLYDSQRAYMENRNEIERHRHGDR